jgi:hypothetical protein
MSRLTKDQIKRLNSIIREKDLFAEFNDLLKRYGAGDLMLREFTVQPVTQLGSMRIADDTNVPSTNKIVKNKATRNIIAHFTLPRPICPHGLPMVEECKVGGKCEWVCNH